MGQRRGLERRITLKPAMRQVGVASGMEIVLVPVTAPPYTGWGPRARGEPGRRPADGARSSGNGTLAMAAERRIPAGWEATAISDAGQWDEIHRKVK